jgi:hypothetical protein
VWAAAQWALNAAMDANPIGIVVAAIAALIAAAVWAYQNVDWFRSGVDAAWSAIQAVISFAWDNVLKPIFDNWEIAISVLLGPIGLLAAVVIDNWDKISGAAQWAWDNVLQPIWNGILGFINDWLIPAFQQYLAIAQAVWNGISAVVSSAWNTIGGVFDWIRGGISSVMSFFGYMRDGISNAVSTIADILWGPFRTAFNWIARGWNDTVGNLSFTMPSWVPGIGGKGFSMPKLPTFHTGGTFLADTPGGVGLALLRDREKILTPSSTLASSSAAAPAQGAGTTYVIVQVDGSVITTAEDLTRTVVDAFQSTQQGQVRPLLAGLT